MEYNPVSSWDCILETSISDPLSCNAGVRGHSHLRESRWNLKDAQMWIQLAPVPNTISAERFAFDLLCVGWAFFADFGELMDFLPPVSHSRRSSVVDLEQTNGNLFCCGAYRHGPMCVLMSNTTQFQNVCRLLASCIKGLCPRACYTS